MGWRLIKTLTVAKLLIDDTAENKRWIDAGWTLRYAEALIQLAGATEPCVSLIERKVVRWWLIPLITVVVTVNCVEIDSADIDGDYDGHQLNSDSALFTSNGNEDTSSIIRMNGQYSSID